MGRPCHLESIDRLQLPVGKLGHKSHLPEKYLEGAFDNDHTIMVMTDDDNDDVWDND